MEFVLKLKDALARVSEQPSPKQLEIMASAFLIPLEYETLNRILCPQCGGLYLQQIERCSVPSKYEHIVWPYFGPSGDRYECYCKNCNYHMTVTFWFSE